jgi:hypothetical protein
MVFAEALRRFCCPRITLIDARAYLQWRRNISPRNSWFKSTAILIWGFTPSGFSPKALAQPLFFLYKQFAPLILSAFKLKPPCSNYATNSLEFLTEGQSFLRAVPKPSPRSRVGSSRASVPPHFEVAAMLRVSDCIPSDGQCNNEATTYILS